MKSWLRCLWEVIVGILIGMGAVVCSFAFIIAFLAFIGFFVNLFQIVVGP